MSKFKGTKGPLEPKYVSGICIGIGTVGVFLSQITANSILPKTDEEYINEKQEIEANMLLYSKAPEMLEMLIFLNETCVEESSISDKVEKLIKQATEI